MRRILGTLCAALLVLTGCSSTGGEPDTGRPAPTESTDDGGATDRGADRPGIGQPPADTGQAAPHTGALGSSATMSCVEEYSPTAVAGRAFAFDGTVTAIGQSVTDRGDSGDLGYAGVTFAVEEWFVGDGPATFTVDLGAPEKVPMSEAGASYGIGTRLLVSGEDRWGEGGLVDPIAWGCGFTRYYDEETAAAWRS